MSEQEARVAEIAAALDGEDAPDQPEAQDDSAPVDGTGAPEEKEETTPEAVEQEAPQAEEDDFDLDLTGIPEDASEARNWIAKRHKEMQGLLTRKTQAIAQERKELDEFRALQEAFNNPEKHPELLAKLGYELDDEDDDWDDEEDDSTPELRDPRVDQLLQQFQQREAKEAFLADVEGQFDELQAKIGREFDDESEIQLIHDLAAARSNGGRLNIEGAYEAIQARDKQLLKGYAKSKKAPAAPKGESAKHTPDLDNEEARAQYVAERINALEAQDV